MKKKIGTYVKVSEDYLTEEHGVLEFAKPIIVSTIKKAIPKGWVPFSTIRYDSGRTDNDFIYNQITVTGQQFIVRAPRIIANRYHKK